MLNTHKNDKGLTLVELLVVIALVGVVASIAFPVVSNVIAGAQTNATAASTEAVDNFKKQYANFNLTQDGSDIVASTDAGAEIARIAGSLSGGGTVIPANPVYTDGTDFTGYTFMGMTFSANTWANGPSYNEGGLVVGAPTDAMKAALMALADGATVTINGSDYTVRTQAGFMGSPSTTYDANFQGSGAFALYLSGSLTSSNVNTVQVKPVDPNAPAPAVTYLGAQMNSADNTFVGETGMNTVYFSNMNMDMVTRASFKVVSTGLLAKLQAFTDGSTMKINGANYVVSNITVSQVSDPMNGQQYWRVVLDVPTFNSMMDNTLRSITL